MRALCGPLCLSEAGGRVFWGWKVVVVVEFLCEFSKKLPPREKLYLVNRFFRWKTQLDITEVHNSGCLHAMLHAFVRWMDKSDFF